MANSEESDAATRRPRKSTYLVRKEEKAALDTEAAALEKRREQLRAERRVANALLRLAVQRQHHALAHAQAAVSASTQQALHLVSPLGPGLQLSGDEAERQAQLQARRPVSVRDGLAYIRTRSQFLDRSVPFAEQSASETTGGDCFITRFEVVPLRGVTASVKCVLGALVHSLSHAELTISETSEFITIRQDGDWILEDDTMLAKGMAVQRVLSSSEQGMLVESEIASFVEYFDNVDGNDGPVGILTTDSVEHDERYPYQSQERFRRDVSSIIMVDQVARSGMEPVVVLTLWSLCTFRPPTGNKYMGIAKALPPRYPGWGGGMVEDLKQILQAEQ